MAKSKKNEPAGRRTPPLVPWTGAAPLLRRRRRGRLPQTRFQPRKHQQQQVPLAAAAAEPPVVLPFAAFVVVVGCLAASGGLVR